VVRTGFGAEDPGRVLGLLTPIARLFMKTPEQGAATPVYLASSPQVEGVNGAYFANNKPKRSSKRSYDTDVAAQLWTVSARLVGLVNDRPGSAARS
jgi:hypothetical protein